MIEFVAGLLVGLLIGLLVARVAYAYGYYRGQIAAKWAGYDIMAKAKRKGWDDGSDSVD